VTIPEPVADFLAGLSLAVILALFLLSMLSLYASLAGSQL
jgi:hypothetical protein